MNASWIELREMHKRTCMHASSMVQLLFGHGTTWRWYGNIEYNNSSAYRMQFGCDRTKCKPNFRTLRFHFVCIYSIGWIGMSWKLLQTGCLTVKFRSIDMTNDMGVFFPCLFFVFSSSSHSILFIIMTTLLLMIKTFECIFNGPKTISTEQFKCPQK